MNNMIKTVQYVNINCLFDNERTLEYFCDHCDYWSFGDASYTLIDKNIFIKAIKEMQIDAPDAMQIQFTKVIEILESILLPIYVNLEN